MLKPSYFNEKSSCFAPMMQGMWPYQSLISAFGEKEQNLIMKRI